MKRMVAVGKTMLLVGVNNMSNLKEEKMNVTRLTVVIRTYQGYTYATTS